MSQRGSSFEGMGRQSQATMVIEERAASRGESIYEDYRRRKSEGYVPVAETAKYIRADLKTNFPTVPMSVRSDSYSGGSSVDIYYTDGPSPDKVEAITQRYDDIDRDPQGEILSGSNRYVFVKRDISPEVQSEVEAKVKKSWGSNWDPLPAYEKQRLVYQELKSHDYPPKPVVKTP